MTIYSVANATRLRRHLGYHLPEEESLRRVSKMLDLWTMHYEAYYDRVLGVWVIEPIIIEKRVSA